MRGARGPFPLRLGRNHGALPARIGLGVFDSDVHHRKGAAPVNVGGRAAGMAPVCPGHIAPPLRGAALTRQAGRADKHHRAGQAHLGRQLGVRFGVHRALGHGAVAGGLHKGGELVVAYFGAVHPEARHGHGTDGCFFGVDGVAQRQSTPRHPHPARVERICGLRRQRANQALLVGQLFSALRRPQ